MKQLITALLVFSLTLSYAQESFTFEFDGETREYIFYIPEDVSAQAPLIFALHGYTSSNTIISQYSGFSELADEAGFAVCYPQGLLDNFNITHWNSNLQNTTSDDVGFLTALAAYLQETYNLSADNTFSCGMSNGGFMSYTLACEAPHVFKAIASVTGTMSGFDWENCGDNDPIPVMQISGTIDNVVPMDGSMSTNGGWGGAPHIDEVIAYWTERLELDEMESSLNGATLDTEMRIHSSATSNYEVWQYIVNGMEHTWPGFWLDCGFEARYDIWEFFERHLSPVSSISNPEDLSITLSPNPSSSFLLIEAGHKVKHISIMDLLGNPIKQIESPKQNVFQIEINDLVAGHYLINVDGISKRFIKI